MTTRAPTASASSSVDEQRAADPAPNEPPPVALASLTGGVAEPRVPPRADDRGLGRALDPERSLASIADQTFVYAAPGYGAKKLGYLRAGAVVTRAAAAEAYDGCKQGWYRVSPEGYVCVGRTATLDVRHPLVVAAHVRPDRESPLPYRYGLSRFPPPPLYTKVPDRREQHLVEHDLGSTNAPHLAAAWRDVTIEDVPEFLRGGRASMTLSGFQHSGDSIYAGHALPKSGFAFTSFFEAEGRRVGLSVDLAVMPLDRLTPVAPSAFHGVELGTNVTLPVVFVMQRAALTWIGDPTGTGLKPSRTLGFRDAVAITGERRSLGGKLSYLKTTDGEWLRDEGLVRVDALRGAPGWATPGRTWIDVSILKQTLVAYEGTTPRYVTLVSTGADGLGDPKKTHSTVLGQFLIHTKHVTATMSGDEVGDEFELRDVPYVQYFTEGFAFHAAYWHDGFGKPRSHGCVNLAPSDARWLFHWTDPPVPAAWHGAMSRDGTLVNIHP